VLQERARREKWSNKELVSRNNSRKRAPESLEPVHRLVQLKDQYMLEKNEHEGGKMFHL